MWTLPTGLVIEGYKVLYKRIEILQSYEYDKLFSLLEKGNPTFKVEKYIVIYR